ncbi:MAG: HAMP domain-containing histidine kinase [Trueperaceae bacterium]|nr:MAG: HAMP domain-containing histidine kinase [Trueperaceae bacterium]
MKQSRNVSLYWRLLASYLLVITVGSATFLLTGESLAPFFLERHVSSMMRTMRSSVAEGMMSAMTIDLNQAYRTALNQSLFWAVFVSVLAASAVGTFVTRRIVKPLREMRHASSRIAAGQYRERLTTHAPGEVGDLASAFNTMAETLEQSEQRRVELLANVAHEFRTPLSNLLGYIEGLEDNLFTLDTDTLSACKRQIERLERLVDDLALLSSVETGQIEFSQEPISASELLEWAVEAFQPQFEKKGVSLILQPGAPSVEILADAERTGQVLTNFLANALRHTGSGGKVELAFEAQQPNEVVFTVRDSGEGIPVEALSNIFTRFYRADKARVREGGGGSGIGLTIAKNYVEQQGGRIGVTSEVGKGSEFWFTLPRSSKFLARNLLASEAYRT